MKDLKLSSGLAGGGIGLVLIALFYLGERLWRLPFLPFDFFDWLARALPGDLITLGIDVIVGVVLAFDIGRSTSATAKFIEQLLALFLFVFLWAVLGGVVAAAGRRSRLTPDQAGAAAGFALGLGGVGISSALGNGPGIAGGAWLIALPLGGGWALGRVLAAAPPEGEPGGRSLPARVARRPWPTWPPRRRSSRGGWSRLPAPGWS